MIECSCGVVEGERGFRPPAGLKLVRSRSLEADSDRSRSGSDSTEPQCDRVTPHRQIASNFVIFLPSKSRASPSPAMWDSIKLGVLHQRHSLQRFQIHRNLPASQDPEIMIGYASASPWNPYFCTTGEDILRLTP